MSTVSHELEQLQLICDIYQSEIDVLNIHKNVDKNQIRTGEAVEIRLTILKDGGYEQLSSTKGDNEYFELFRSSIKEAFPVKIDNSLKESFPRYFRMKIEF